MLMFDKQTNRHRGEFFSLSLSLSLVPQNICGPFPCFNEPEVRSLANAQTQTLECYSSTLTQCQCIMHGRMLISKGLIQF